MNREQTVPIKLLGKVRAILSTTTILCLIYSGIGLISDVAAANPPAGSVSPTGPVNPWNGTWDGTLTGAPPAANGESDCVPTAGAVGNCDDFTLTVTGTQASWQGKLIRIRYTWTSPSTDYDMAVRHESNGIPGLQGDGACAGPGQSSTCPGPFDDLVGSSGNGASTSEEVVLNPAATGVGDYYVRAIYFAPNAADQYHAVVTVFNAPGAGATVSVVPPTFDNYQPPDPSYPRRDDSGEPSLGVNWNSGNVMTMSRLQCNRTAFNDSTSPADPINGTSWFHQTSQVLVTGLDPILFTDPVTGRTICGELQGALGSTNGVMSDDDLATATQAFQTGGPTQGVDHQSIASGPPKKLTLNGQPYRQPSTAYPHLFYYASQQTAYASVSTSFDGGISYQPAVPAYTLAQCTNLHGHLKVGPDGTVYLPNRSCGSKAAVIVSEDNGLNWSIRPVPTSSSGKSDPSVGIGAGGKLYLGYTDGSQHPHVAISDDHGVTWGNDIDLSPFTQFPAQTGGGALRASVFPAMVAGDNDRAAIFFHATNSQDPLDPVGDDNGGNGPNFKGTWYPFIAVTADGGNSWTVVRADNDPLHPGALNPVQQGVICENGTVCPGGPPDTRNLLDFMDVSVDSAGRVVAVYADGCNFDHPCVGINNNSGDRTSNQGTARLTIIRQRGGTRLFRSFDPAPAPPPAPFVDAQSAKNGVAVLWGTPADNGSAITEYRVYRGSPSKPERLVTVAKPGTNSIVDKQGKPGDYYHVAAVNKYGESRKPAKSFVRKARSAR